MEKKPLNLDTPPEYRNTHRRQNTGIDIFDSQQSNVINGQITVIIFCTNQRRIPKDRSSFLLLKPFRFNHRTSKSRGKLFYRLIQ